MDGGIPCTNPHIDLLQNCLPLLETCNTLFLEWYRQQHSCNNNNKFKLSTSGSSITVQRLMTFITRYTPNPGEEALLKHVDGAGKVDGSIVVALPIDRWSAPGDVNSFDGYGGGLTVWDGKDSSTGDAIKLDYATRSGDIAFLDRYVHPIHKKYLYIYCLTIFLQYLGFMYDIL